MNIKTEFALRLSEQIDKIDVITPESLAEMLLSTGIVAEVRALQFCAVCEFYDTISTTKKTQTIQRLSEKYNISERTLTELTGSVRRFCV